jgi:hypothetical protein
MINKMINSEFERTWKEDVIAQFKVLYQHLAGGTEDNHEKPQDCGALHVEILTRNLPNAKEC